MDEAECPVCGGKPGDRIDRLPGQSGAELSLLICEVCGIVFVEKRNRPESRPPIEGANWGGEYDNTWNG